MDKSQFDHICLNQPYLRCAGDSYSYIHHGVCIGAHWFSDGTIAIFVDDAGTTIYSNIKIETADQLRDALIAANKTLVEAIATKTDDYPLLNVLNSAYENQRPEDK